MNRVQPTEYGSTIRERQQKLPKSRYLHLTFYELLTIVITTAIPIAIGVYTVLTTNQQAKATVHQLDEEDRIASERRAFDLKLAAELRQQQVYDRFIDDIYTLHKDGELNDSVNPWAFANARYRVAHLQWGTMWKSHALQFMKEKALIGRNRCQTGCEPQYLKDIIRLNALNFVHVNLTSQTSQLTQMDMKCVRFEQVSLREAMFTNINLNGVSFDGSLLDGAKFNGSSLSCVTFNGTKMNNVDFGNSNLEKAQFINVDLSTVKLTEKQKQQISNNKITSTLVTRKTTTVKTKSTEKVTMSILHTSRTESKAKFSTTPVFNTEPFLTGALASTTAG